MIQLMVHQDKSKKYYCSGRKLTRADIAYVRASNLSASRVAAMLDVSASHVRKIRSGQRGASVPAWVKPSHKCKNIEAEIKGLLRLFRQLIRELKCEILQRELDRLQKNLVPNTSENIQQIKPYSLIDTDAYLERCRVFWQNIQANRQRGQASLEVREKSTVESSDLQPAAP